MTGSTTAGHTMYGFCQEIEAERFWILKDNISSTSFNFDFLPINMDVESFGQIATIESLSSQSIILYDLMNRR